MSAILYLNMVAEPAESGWPMGAKQHMPWFLVFMSLGVAISYCWDGSLAYGQMEELQIQNMISLRMHVQGISMWDWCPWFVLSGLVPDYTKRKAAGFILHVVTRQTVCCTDVVCHTHKICILVTDFA